MFIKVKIRNREILINTAHIISVERSENNYDWVEIKCRDGVSYTTGVCDMTREELDKIIEQIYKKN